MLVYTWYIPGQVNSEMPFLQVPDDDSETGINDGLFSSHIYQSQSPGPGPAAGPAGVIQVAGHGDPAPRPAAGPVTVTAEPQAASEHPQSGECIFCILK